jgi:glycerol-3-phosphate dehydrogenase
VTVAGGKLTTYRSTAEEVVDVACRSLGWGGRTRTASVSLGLRGDLRRVLGEAEDAVAEAGFSPVLGRRLVSLYGDDWTAALALLRDAPSLGEPLVPGLPVREVEVEMARRREMAITDEDVLERRTRITTMDARASATVI